MLTASYHKWPFYYLAILLVSTCVCGCGSLQNSAKPEGYPYVTDKQSAPNPLARRTIKSFTKAVRCMERWLATNPQAEEILSRYTALRPLTGHGDIGSLDNYYELPFGKCMVNLSDDIEYMYNKDYASSPGIPNKRRIRHSTPKNNMLPEMVSDALKLTLKAKGSGKSVIYRRGDSVELVLSVSTDAHVFCYYKQHSGEIYQIFPTPYDQSSRVSVESTLKLPTDNRLKIIADSPGPEEFIQCVGHSLARIGDLPTLLRRTGFSSLPFKSLHEVIEQHRLVNKSLAVSRKFMLFLNW